MQIEKKLFGTDENGRHIYRYDVQNDSIKASFCEVGASILSVVVTDKNGIERDVVLGLDSCEAYRRNWPAFGSVIGRYANRIHKAKFELNGTLYKLKKNAPGGCLHSGYSYHYRRWDSEAFEDEMGIHVVFRLKSEDMDQGFPGNLSVEVDYVLSEDKALTIFYRYVSDKDTIVNLTNHCYFNLLGHAAGSVMNHRVCIHSGKVTQVDKQLMPTGAILDVEGSAFDFRNMCTIRENQKKAFSPFCHEKEYDINYVLAEKAGEYKEAAVLEAQETGIGMRVLTDMPGMQFYTGNAVNGIIGKENVKYQKNPGVCFETQFYPDAVNQENFPSPIIKAGEEKQTKTRFEFYIVEE